MDAGASNLDSIEINLVTIPWANAPHLLGLHPLARVDRALRKNVDADVPCPGILIHEMSRYRVLGLGVIDFREVASPRRECWWGPGRGGGHAYPQLSVWSRISSFWGGIQNSWWAEAMGTGWRQGSFAVGELCKYFWGWVARSSQGCPVSMHSALLVFHWGPR